jgi:DNA-binding FadR family transcriptional regulator
MKICQSCYAGLFEAGARWPRNREFEERLGEIQALAREGLRRLKRPKIVSVGKVRYGAYERRHR